MTALAAIHVAKKQLGLDEDTYRDVLVRATGKRSAGDMTPAEQDRALAEFRRLGFKPASKAASKRADGPYRKILQAHWIAMWNLGLIPDPSDVGLHGFVKRQTTLDHTRFLIDQEAASAVIEALKARMTRDAKVDWRHDRFLPDWTQSPGYRIAAAQFRILKERDAAFAGFAELQHWLIRTADERPGCGNLVGRMLQQHWIVVMNALGERIRKGKA